MVGYFGKCCAVIFNYICCVGTQKTERVGFPEPAVSFPLQSRERSRHLWNMVPIIHRWAFKARSLNYVSKHLF